MFDTLQVGNTSYSGTFHATNNPPYFDLLKETPFPTELDIKKNPEMTVVKNNKKYSVTLSKNSSITTYAKVQGAPLRLIVDIWN